MSFWKNERYSRFERQASGDPIRGLTRHDFPWSVLVAERTDPSGDNWHMEILVNSVGEQDLTGKVVVQFEARAHCTPTLPRLQTLGINPERLTWLGLNGQELLTESFPIQVRLALDDLTTVAKRALEKLSEHIAQKYNSDKKRQTIQEKMEECPISRFSSRDGSHKTL